MSPQPTTAVLLHLSGPLQSWGERSRFNQRDTSRTPTRSGLIGLIAAALGRRRDQPIDDLTALRFTTRVDRSGTLLRDFHTVGGGMPRPLTVVTAEGKRRSADTATLISNRYYLQDAAFTVSVTAQDPTLLDTCAQALRAPFWPPYLGRRSCPPDAPLLITTTSGDPIDHLIGLPLARTAPQRTQSVTVEFRADAAFTGNWPDGPDPSEHHQVHTQIQDDPVSFAPNSRQYRTRPVYRRHLQLPAAQCAGLGIDYVNSLATYLKQSTGENTP
ncbi:type I-E CRISPR-associated protein Cas5/CasD [Actinomadura geliboluensis]|uniref:Type I-E CRISPR-associated protein Cas5/CasD n=1 Tax=Actinomadura geliboluensis TaxID=882440 RepID=A0A5S4GM47_9ACTN|nr:type I-E CRISPR-associated protein Cas5/CasD [Actinomadura geliboluensis]TMR33594.1 type I-E CRISPR-associated protein Cas5/CasD [Actinomadura geliboluensis]